MRILVCICSLRNSRANNARRMPCSGLERGLDLTMLLGPETGRAAFIAGVYLQGRGAVYSQPAGMYCVFRTEGVSLRLPGFFEVVGVDFVFSQQVVEIGAVLPRQPGRLADVAAGKLEQADQIIFFESALGLLQRPPGLLG